MSQNLGNTVDALNDLKKTELFDLKEPPRLINRRLKSKRDSRKNLSCTGCNQDYNGFYSSIGNTKAIKRISRHGRKRLHNENIPIFFCSVPICYYSSNNKQAFEKHYELCYKTYHKKQDGKNRSTGIISNGFMMDNNCKLTDITVDKDCCSENNTDEYKEDGIENKDRHDSFKLANLCSSTSTNDIELAFTNRKAESMMNEGTTCKTYQIPRFDK